MAFSSWALAMWSRCALPYDNVLNRLAMLRQYGEDSRYVITGIDNNGFGEVSEARTEQLQPNKPTAEVYRIM